MPVEIRVNDIGPVVEFEYALDGYGLHVLRGRNGAGKTTITRAVELAVDGRTDTRLSHRDGTRRGEAYVAGQTIRISKQTRVEGELSLVAGLGDLSIADLHTPKFLKPTTRDEHRIKTLVRLTGVSADARLFEPLLGERFYEVVQVDSLKTDDLLDMACRVKRAIESEACRVEKRKETELANARAQSQIAESIDTSLPHSEEQLQSDLEAAIRGHAQAKAALDGLLRRQREASETAGRAEDARARLEGIGGGITVTEAQDNLTAAETNVAAVTEQVARIRQKLLEAESVLREVTAARDTASSVLQSARREQALHAELHAAIEAAKSIEPPSANELLAAEAAVSEATEDVAYSKDSVTIGVKVRTALEAKTKAEFYMDRANELGTEAKRLRNAARDTFDVLSNTIQSIRDCPLRVKLDDDMSARLVIATDRSEIEYFDELSDGEKWAVVVGIAAKENRLIVLPQSAFGELAPSLRIRIHELAMENSCYILTALAEDCELHGAVYSDMRSDVAE